MEVFSQIIFNIVDFFLLGETISWKHFAYFFLTIICSSLFSASEIAIFRVQEYQLKEDNQTIKKKYKTLSLLINNKEKTLSTILVGNNIANVFATLYGTHLISFIFYEKFNFPKDLSLTAAGVVIVILLLFFGEIIPKNIAVHNSIRWAKVLAPFIYFCTKIFWILTILASKLVFNINKLFKNPQDTVSDAQVLAIVNQGSKEGVFEKNEKEVIQNILNFNETNVVTIMTPRSKVFFLAEDEKIHTVKKKIAESGHSRIPIHAKGNINNIKGIINQKDIFKYIIKNNFKSLKLSAIATSPIYVYQATPIQDIFQKLQKEHQQLAVVVDDFGEFEGIITIEDILEEIIGEIRDEKDLRQEDSSISVIKKGKWVAKNVVDINTFMRVTGAEIKGYEKAPYETLQGLIMYKIGRLPKVGDSLKIDGFSFKVKAMDEDRITLLHIAKIPAKPNANSKEK